MQTEYEVKILGIDAVELIHKLRGFDGLKAEPPQSFRRYVYGADEKSWLRLRTDGLRTTLTYKLYNENTVEGVQELEIEVSDFDKTHQILKLAGLKVLTYQENKRERFTNSEVELSVDSWPHIPPYLEIEGDSTKTVKKYVDQLALNDFEKTSEPTSAVYKRYGLDINEYEKLTF